MAGKKGKGGIAFHKPECPCRTCSSHRRQAEALLKSAREGWDTPTVPANTVFTIARRDLKDKIAQWLMHKAAEPGISNKEVASRMGVQPATLNRWVKEAHEKGLLKFDDPLDRMRFEVVPKVMDNLLHFLDAKDKAVTIETAKGTVFKSFQASEGIVEGSKTVLMLKIESIEPDSVKVISGNIVGVPRGLPPPAAQGEDN